MATAFSLPRAAFITIIIIHLCNNIRSVYFLSSAQNRVKVAAEEQLSSALSFLPNSSATLENHHSNSQQPSPLCSRQQIQNGEWKPVSLPKPPYVTKTQHLRCYPIEHYKRKPWETWEWRPLDSSCRLTTWNATEFCQLTPLTTISIIGDSLSWEQYSSLLQLLGARVHQTSQHISKTEDRNHIQRGCHGATKFVWRNDAYLSKVSESMADDFPIVLILNRGSHFVNDTLLLAGIQKLVTELREWQDSCQRLQLKCHLFWRTSVPGHPNCANTSQQPVNDLAAMEARVANLSLYNNRSINYHWYDYQHQNELVLQELAKSGLNYEVIDAYYLNILRPDEHRAHQGDCLHNCYPGKMDVYNQLLLHFLKMQRSRAEVQRLEALYRAVQVRRRQRGAERRLEESIR